MPARGLFGGNEIGVKFLSPTAYVAQLTLPAGERVHIVQKLGESITIRTEFGALFRVDGTDADALGVDDPGRNREVAATSRAFAMSDVTAALQNVYDPEIPVSVVELGLIYRCDEELRSDGTRVISIDMAMTAPGCGMGDVLRAEAERVARAGPVVAGVQVQRVWAHPGTPRPAAAPGA